MQTLLNSLRYLPTMLFLVSLYTANMLLVGDSATNRENYSGSKLSVDDLWWEDEFVSLKEKRDWCKKRFQCRTLAEAGFFESGIQNDAGVISVMSVIYNRIESDHPIFVNQKTVSDVVYKHKQFSYRNGKRGELWIPSKRQRERMWVLAYDKMNGLIEDNTTGSLYYYATYIKKPRFAEEYKYTITYAEHDFYKH